MVLGFGNNFNMLGMNGGCFGNSTMFNSMNSTGMFGNMFGGSSIFGNGFNMFGCGSNMFMNCNGSPNFNAMAGVAVGQVLMNIGGAALSQVITEKQANSSATLEANVNTLQSQIDAKLESLGANEDDYMDLNATEESSYITKKSSIEDNIKNYEKDKLSDSDLSAKKTIVSDYEKLVSPADDDKIASGKADYEAAKAAIAKHEAAVENIKKEEKELEALETEAAKRQENVIDPAKKEIKNLIEQRDEIQAQLNDKLLDKADGNKRNRTNGLDVSTIEKGCQNFDQNDIRELIYQFRVAHEGSDTKRKYAQALVDLDDVVFANIANKTQIQARELAYDYLEKHPSTEV